jgi:hypothetical protein
MRTGQASATPGIRRVTVRFGERAGTVRVWYRPAAFTPALIAQSEELINTGQRVLAFELAIKAAVTGWELTDSIEDGIEALRSFNDGLMLGMIFSAMIEDLQQIQTEAGAYVEASVNRLTSHKQGGR